MPLSAVEDKERIAFALEEVTADVRVRQRRVTVKPHALHTINPQTIYNLQWIMEKELSTLNYKL